MAENARVKTLTPGNHALEKRPRMGLDNLLTDMPLVGLHATRGSPESSHQESGLERRVSRIEVWKPLWSSGVNPHDSHGRVTIATDAQPA